MIAAPTLVLTSSSLPSLALYSSPPSSPQESEKKIGRASSFSGEKSSTSDTVPADNSRKAITPAGSHPSYLRNHNRGRNITVRQEENLSTSTIDADMSNNSNSSSDNSIPNHNTNTEHTAPPIIVSSPSTKKFVDDNNKSDDDYKSPSAGNGQHNVMMRYSNDSLSAAEVPQTVRAATVTPTHPSQSKTTKGTFLPYRPVPAPSSANAVRLSHQEPALHQALVPQKTPLSRPQQTPLSQQAFLPQQITVPKVKPSLRQAPFSQQSFIPQKAPISPGLSSHSAGTNAAHITVAESQLRPLPYQQAHAKARPHYASPHRLLVPPYVASKVIKGEIHNLLTVMRSDPRAYMTHTRFVMEEIGTFEEHPTSAGTGNPGGVKNNHGSNVGDVGGGITGGMHPLIHSLQHVHRRLALDEQDTVVFSSHLQDYFRPFCEAVSARDVSAIVTGAALKALQKFLLYGFVLPETPRAPSIMKLIAESLLSCRFEEQQQQTRSNLPIVGAVVPHRNQGHHVANFPLSSIVEEEQVVLKLLNVSALTVRCSLQSDRLMIAPDLIVGLLETCLHVSHRAKRASLLLKSAALDALSQMVLQVFCSPPSGPVVKARQDILQQLARLLNPALHSPLITQTSLTLVNIALETVQEPLTQSEIAVFQNDLCKYLLLTSTTQDLILLSLTLRVIFNLFYSSIRNHLKVPLEVFLTSVHLRILDTDLQEEREVVLESLIEFCQEPALMKDIYRNYDCDISCTNLFESMVASLGRVALPAGYQPPIVPSVIQGSFQKTTVATGGSGDDGWTTTSAHTKTAPSDFSTTISSAKLINGVNNSHSPGSVLHSNTSGSHVGQQSTLNSPTPLERTSSARGLLLSMNLLATNKGSDHSPAVSGASSVSKTAQSSSQLQQQAITATPADLAPAPVTHLNRLALEALLAVLDSITKRCGGVTVLQKNNYSNVSVTLSDDVLETTSDRMTQGNMALNSQFVRQQRPKDQAACEVEQQQVVSEEELRDRKLKKHSMTRVAQAFNQDPMGSVWIDLAVQEGLIDNGDRHAQDVADFLYTAPDLDKVEVGIYLSKGPDTDYPFHAKVRACFLSLFDFSGLPFAASLRKFLSKFRLPGEAQCIDRLMEAFSTELYKQLGQSSFFKSSDALYVLAFSTIMLNTDLHNPTIKKENRMTKAQFIRNNRGINEGDDLPADFLGELYDQIKETQIQVRREMGDIMQKHENVDFRTAWENILAKSGEVATPAFTPASGARKASVQASVHDKEMFKVLTRWLLPSLTGVFLRSWDDALVVKAVRGMKQLARVASYFGLDFIVNDILLMLLPMGRDYVMGCVALDMAAVNDNASLLSGSRTVNSIDTTEEDDDQTAYDADSPIPYGLLCSNDKTHNELDINGSAAHRGILALDCSFVLLRRYAAGVTTAWPSFVQCLCALRDAQALPAGLADLDDFADSNGRVLPRTAYAKKSQKRLDDFYRSQLERDTKKSKSWFRSLFRKGPAEKEEDLLDGIEGNERYRREPSTYTRALLGVAEAADVENVIQMGSTTLPAAEQTIRALLDAVAAYPYDEDPVLEQHAVFSLELAARALLANKDRAPELFKYFLGTFEDILGRVSDTYLPAPFVLERIVVTILRSCIHLYDLPELRPHLRSSLHLLMMVLPKSFITELSDRMACGLAIILRSSYHFFVSPNDWAFMGDTLDILAHHNKARVFVFDGIASTVEYALPHLDGLDETKNNSFIDHSRDVEDYGVTDEDDERPLLSREASNALSRVLIRFVLGFYNNDTSLPVPAMLCLEKVYRHICELIQEDSEIEKKQENTDLGAVAPDKEFWQNVAVAFYSACRSVEPNISGHGAGCFQRNVIATPVDEIPDDKWVAILYLMINKQPPLVAYESRANTFWIIGQLLAHVLPALSHKPENRDDLSDLVTSFASLAQENFRQGRRGNMTPLFEKTLQTVTYLSNHMMTDDWAGEQGFSAWASETLLTELEKVGAAGASFLNQEAVKPVFAGD